LQNFCNSSFAVFFFLFLVVV